MRITVEEDKCVAGGQCVLAAPAVFDQRDEDGKVILLDESPDASQYGNVREAAQICPAACIHITDD